MLHADLRLLGLAHDTEAVQGVIYLVILGVLLLLGLLRLRGGVLGVVALQLAGSRGLQAPGVGPPCAPAVAQAASAGFHLASVGARALALGPQLPGVPPLAAHVDQLLPHGVLVLPHQQLDLVVEAALGLVELPLLLLLHALELVLLLQDQLPPAHAAVPQRLGAPPRAQRVLPRQRALLAAVLGLQDLLLLQVLALQGRHRGLQVVGELGGRLALLLGLRPLGPRLAPLLRAPVVEGVLPEEAGALLLQLPLEVLLRVLLVGLAGAGEVVGEGAVDVLKVLLLLEPALQLGQDRLGAVGGEAEVVVLVLLAGTLLVVVTTVWCEVAGVVEVV